MSHDFTRVIPKNARFLVLTLLGAGLAFATLTGLQAASPGAMGRGGDSPQPQATMSPQDREAMFGPGDSWDGGAAADKMGRAELEAFAPFPLYWWGEDHDGYRLQSARHVSYEAPADIPNGRDWNAVTFIYGACTPDDGEDRCPVPAALHVHSICALRPEMIPNFMKSGPEVQLDGGAILQPLTNAGQAIVWTGSASIDVHYLADPDSIVDATRALRPISGAEPLASPDLSGCEPLDLEAEGILLDGDYPPLPGD